MINAEPGAGKNAPPASNVTPATSSLVYELSDYGITHDTLKQMLRREDVLRLSEHTLKQYKATGHDGYVPITTALQAQVSKEFGLNEEVGTMLLRTAESFARTPAELAEIVSLSLYRRHNRCVDGHVQVGDVAPVLKYPVHALDTVLTKVHLLEYLLSGTAYEEVLRAYNMSVGAASHSIFAIQNSQLFSPVPLILFAGSYT